MGASSKVKEEIQIVLLEVFGGEVKDPDGYATRRVFERIASTDTYTTVSTAMGELDKEGLIVRDMPSKKRCTRIALPEYSSYAPRKSLDTLMEHAATEISDMLRPQVQAAIDAEVAIARDEANAAADKRLKEELEKQRAELMAEVDAMKAKAEEELAMARAVRSEAEEMRTEQNELREKVRVLEHNVEVWRQNALGKPRFQEAMATIRDRMDESARRQLDSLMRSLPSGNGTG